MKTFKKTELYAVINVLLTPRPELDTLIRLFKSFSRRAIADYYNTKERGYPPLSA